MRPNQTNSGSWQPGQSGNPSGRPKGSKNKRSKQVKEEMFKWVMEVMKYANLKEAEKNMSMKDAIVIAEKMLKHLMPQQKHVKKKISGDIKINVNYKDKPVDSDSDENLEPVEE